MKRIVYIFAIVAMLFVWSGTTDAQCDPNVSGPIRCGYYDAGYRDGANDARANRSNDYRRYRNKFTSQYESFYRNGYEAGFASVQPTYPNYPDPGYPGGGNTATWSGRVDNVGQVILQGNSIRTQDVAGSGMTTTYQNVTGMLPHRNTIVTAVKRDGRGDVSVIQQPSRSNGYTAIIQISDPKGGADDYRVNISWQGQGGPNREEPYSSGRATWRGRVDQSVNVVISGGNISTEWVAGRNVIGELANISGYLARRPASVRVRKIKGRGSVTMIEQPSRQNDYTAVVRIDDPKGSDDYYEIEISW